MLCIALFKIYYLPWQQAGCQASLKRINSSPFQFIFCTLDIIKFEIRRITFRFRRSFSLLLQSPLGLLFLVWRVALVPSFRRIRGSHLSWLPPRQNISHLLIDVHIEVNVQAAFKIDSITNLLINSCLWPGIATLRSIDECCSAGWTFPPTPLKSLTLP